MASPNRRKLWTVPREIQLEWRTWNDESVVFNRASGDTHLLDSVAAQVLRRLESRPTSIEELCEHVESSSDVDHDLSLHIETLVHKLDELGLIAPIGP